VKCDRYFTHLPTDQRVVMYYVHYVLIAIYVMYIFTSPPNIFILARIFAFSSHSQLSHDLESTIDPLLRQLIGDGKYGRISLLVLMTSSIFQDTLYISFGVAYILGSWLLSSLRHQFRVDDLKNPNILSQYLGRKVLAVEDNENNTIGEGGGGTGTNRSFLVATTDNNEKLYLFVKTPSVSWLERLFLTLFKIYDNEITAYEKYVNNFSIGLRLKEWDVTPKVFFCRKFGMGKFVIILEDLRYRNSGCIFKTNFDQTFDVKSAETILELLAKMHSIYWNRYPTDIWGYSPLTGLPNKYTPPHLRTLLLAALSQVKKRYSTLVKLHPDCLKAFELAVNNFNQLRKFWSSGALTMCHGDAHMGNVFTSIVRGQLQAGLLDFQCVSVEHHMRDVSYHLINSCPSEELTHLEGPLIQYYLQKLYEAFQQSIVNGIRTEMEEVPSFESAYFMYRSHAVHSLIAWIMTCGFGNLVKEDFAVRSLSRVMDTCLRLQVLQAVRQSIVVGQ